MQRHFVSYPKSGRTWIRYIFAQLSLEQQILFHHDRFEFSDCVKLPHNFNLSERLAQYSKVEKLVYLDRDPRDVMVSLYFQITGRMRDVFEYQGSISEFLRDDYFGAHNLKHFRKMWAEITAQMGFLRISYEECHQDIEGTIRRILTYYDLAVNPLPLSQAIANADFKPMKDLEQSGKFPEPWLKPRNNAPKVREGRIGGFRNSLTDDDIAYLNDLFGC